MPSSCSAFLRSGSILLQIAALQHTDLSHDAFYWVSGARAKGCVYDRCLPHLTSVNKERQLLKLQLHKSRSFSPKDTGLSDIAFSMVAQRGVVFSSVALVTLSLVSLGSARALSGCPPVDDKDSNATYIANPLDCSTFFICQQGLPVLMPCPAGLLFNDALNVCDYAYNVSCVPLYPTITTKAPAPAEATTKTIAVEESVVKQTVVKEKVPPAAEDDAPVTSKSDATKVEEEAPASVDAGTVTQAAVVGTKVNDGVNSVGKPVEGTVDKAPEQRDAGDVAGGNDDVSQAVL
nr:chondroitin proteoglycan 1-like [Dermacentor andersoni]